MRMKFKGVEMQRRFIFVGFFCFSVFLLVYVDAWIAFKQDFIFY